MCRTEGEIGQSALYFSSRSGRFDTEFPLLQTFLSRFKLECSESSESGSSDLFFSFKHLMQFTVIFIPCLLFTY